MYIHVVLHSWTWCLHGGSRASHIRMFTPGHSLATDNGSIRYNTTMFVLYLSKQDLSNMYRAPFDPRPPTAYIIFRVV